MRSSPRRIASRCSREVSRGCILCARPQSSAHKLPSLPLLRQYSDGTKDADKKDEVPSVESTGKVLEEVGIIPTGSSKAQESSPLPDPSQQSSASSPRNPRPKEPWRFKMPPPPTKDPAARAEELSQAMSETSLRKRLVWRAPFLGVNPAYDFALSHLREDRRKKIAAIHRLGTRIAHEKKSILPVIKELTLGGGSLELISQLENARYTQLVLRDINVPEVRWRFQQGDIDLRNPTHQYLYARTWTDSVYVAKIMQRLHTMKIIPDSLPALNPKVEFRLRFREKKTPSRVARRAHGWRDTEAGEKLPSLILMSPPRMEIIPHYREWWESRKYTVIMLDLDVPDVENDSFRTKLHWMVKDIVVSPVKTIVKDGNGETVVPWLPPHPFRGMKYHRYPLFVFEQPPDEWLASRTEVYRQHKESQLEQCSKVPLDSTMAPLLTIPTTSANTLRTYATATNSKYHWSNINRDNFNVRAWANQMGMKPVGAHLVRCEWDDNVPRICESLGIKERAFKKIRSEETDRFDFLPPKSP